MPISSERIIIYLAMIPEAIAVTAGVLKCRQLPTAMLPLFALVLFGFSTDLLSRLLIYLHIPNLVLIKLYIPVEFSLLALIYQYELKGTFTARIIPYLIMLFAGYAVFQIATGNMQRFNREERFVEGLFILLFVFQYLYRVLRNMSISHLESAPMFWLSAGLFIFFPCDIIIFVFSEYIFSSYSRQFSLQLWNVHAILTMLLYIFYTITLWISPKS